MRLFYQPKYLKTQPSEHESLQKEPKKVKNDSFMQLLLPSFLGMILCAVCLAGTTYAWFTASVSAPAVKMESANFEIQVEIMDGQTPVLPEDGYYFLTPREQGKGYAVTVTAIGTASKGYFKINDSIYPEILTPDETITFTFYPKIVEKYSFFAVWGNYSESEQKIVVNNGVVGTPITPENDNS